MTAQGEGGLRDFPDSLRCVDIDAKKKHHVEVGLGHLMSQQNEEDGTMILALLEARQQPGMCRARTPHS